MDKELKEQMCEVIIDKKPIGLVGGFISVLIGAKLARDLEKSKERSKNGPKT